MTWIQYMTSNVPFKEKENEYLLDITIGEALEKGIELPEWHKKYTSAHRILLQLAGYDEAGFSIHPFEKDSVDLRDTDKAFCAEIWWIDTEAKAEGLLRYIREYMQKCNEIELWYLFQGLHTDKPYKEATRYKNVSLEHLNAAVLNEFFGNYEDTPACLLVRNDE